LFSKEILVFGKKNSGSTFRTEVYILDKLVKQWQINLQYTCRYHSGDKINENEVGRARGTYGRQERCIRGLARKTWGKETT